MKPPYQYLLHECDLLKHLAPLDPIFVGTPPLGIATEDSDIDIACTSPDFQRFFEATSNTFGHLQGFALSHLDHLQAPTLLASFNAMGWEIELFCQQIQTADQWGVRHFRVEQRLLTLAPQLRDPIVRLKQEGIKTEPAFAILLNLSGDPYQPVLALEDHDDQQLLSLAEQARV